MTGDSVTVLRQHNKSVEQALLYAAVILISITGNASAIIKPLLLGTYVAHYAFSPRAAGYLVAVEMTAAAIGTLVSSVWLARLNQRRFVLAAIGLILLGNLGAAIIPGVVSLFGWRIVAGLGHGFALGPVGVAIARVAQPDRLAGMVSVAVMSCASGLSFLLPLLQAVFGGRGLFFAMASTVPLALVGLRWFPNGATAPNGANGGLPPMPSRSVTLFAFLGSFIWYLVVGGYWPYVEQFARAAHLDYVSASRVLGFAMLISILGASLSIVVGNRFGRVRVLTLLLAIQVGAVLTMLLGGSHFVAYALSASLFIFAWIALFPYLLGLMSQIDPSGRLNGLLYTAALLGFAIGPAGAGFVIGQARTGAEGLLNVQRIVLGLLLVSAGTLLGLAVGQRRPALGETGG